jgi:group I intron endonuclease
MIIYEIKNRINNKIYVGKHSKCNTNKEFQQTNYWGSGTYIKRAIKRYGIENFEKSVIVENIINEDELDKYERLYIEKKNSKVPNGYNLTDGGEGLLNPSEKTRKLLSEHQIGEKNHRFGKSPSQQQRDKVSQTLINTLQSKEQREKMAERMKGEKNSMFGKTGENSPHFGIVKSKEHKRKLSETHKGKNNGMYGKTFYEVWIEKYGKEIADEKWEKWMKTRQRVN